MTKTTNSKVQLSATLKSEVALDKSNHKAPKGDKTI